MLPGIAFEVSARAAWKPGQSGCTTLPGFEDQDKYPTRSPLLVADFLVPKVKGLDYVETDWLP